MVKQEGFSSFTLLVNKEQYGEMLLTVKDLEQGPMFCVQKTAEYLAYADDNEEFYFVQLDTMFPNCQLEEVCSFIMARIKSISIHQSCSNYIMIPDQEVWKHALVKIYGDIGNKTFVNYYIYDMLTIEERWEAGFQASYEINEMDDVQMYYDDKNGCSYQLNFDKSSPILFKGDTGLMLINNSTGKNEEVDILDGLYIFNFIFAIFKPKKLENK